MIFLSFIFFAMLAIAAALPVPGSPPTRIPFAYHSHSNPAKVGTQPRAILPLPLTPAHVKSRYPRSTDDDQTTQASILTALKQIASGSAMPTPDGSAPPIVNLAIQLVPQSSDGSEWEYQAELLDMSQWQVVPADEEIDDNTEE